MKRKLMPMVLAVAMLLCLASTALAADGGGTLGVAAPKVTIIAVTIEHSYLELGLSIDSGTDELGNALDFRSVGAVLRYNAEALQPCGWVNDEAGNTVAVPIETAVSWDSPAALPTKAPDGINGKTALAYVDQGEKTGYLYVAAETPKPLPLQQPIPVGVTDAPAEHQGENGVNIGTVKALKESTTPLPQAVTVRFQFREKTPAHDDVPAVLYTLAEAKLDLVAAGSGGTFDAAGNTGATNGGFAPALQPLIYWGDSLFPVNPITENPATYQAVDKQLLLVDKGVTVNQGGSGVADPSNCASIVFFDWDGATLIGSIIVDKDTDMDGINAAIEEFVGGHPETFTTKPGYTFENVWLEYESAGATRYGRYIQPGGTAMVSDGVIADSEKADFRKVKQDGTMVVKAAYKGSVDAGLPSATGTAANRYVITPTAYSRLGTSEVYSVTFKVTRQTAAGVPVPRAASPILRVATTSPDGIGYLMVPLDCNDEAYGTVTVPNAVTNIAAFVVDNYQYSNWVGATARSITNNVKKDGLTGYIHLGTLGYINEEILKGSSAIISEADFATIGVDTRGLAMEVIKNRLTALQTELGRSLSVEEIQVALNE